METIKPENINLDDIDMNDDLLIPNIIENKEIEKTQEIKVVNNNEQDK